MKAEQLQRVFRIFSDPTRIFHSVVALGTEHTLQFFVGFQLPVEFIASLRFVCF